MKTKLLKLWPKFIFPKVREKYKKNIHLITVDDRMQDTPSSYVDPWAFIRVKDERKTLLASLNSILPAIHRGVISYNDCTDGSDLIIQEFCKQNPGFIPFHYPHKVIPSGDPTYLTEIPIENTLAGYYNAVLAKIPKGEWFIKIDTDQIYFADILKHSFSLPKNKEEYVSYSRLDLYRPPPHNNLKVWRYRRPNDHWLICNENLNFINTVGFKNGEFYAYEILKIKRKKQYNPECSSLHFPLEKNYRNLVPDETNMVDFDTWAQKANQKEFSSEILDKSVIERIIQSFDFS